MMLVPVGDAGSSTVIGGPGIRSTKFAVPESLLKTGIATFWIPLRVSDPVIRIPEFVDFEYA